MNLPAEAPVVAVAVDGSTSEIAGRLERCRCSGFVMSGPTTPDPRLNDPLAVDRVAKTSRTADRLLSRVYPYVDAIVTVAFRNENLYVSPDIYTFAPGGKLYVEAANSYMKDHCLLGSSFPFRPMK